MGQTELKAALQQEAEQRARQLWREAEARLEERRQEVEAEVARLEQEAGQRLQAKMDTLRTQILLDAQHQAFTRRLHAETHLAERLRHQAETRLAALSAIDRARLWPLLCAELPQGRWGHVRMHPDDGQRAADDYPDADISTDPAIAAGLCVASKDQKIRIDNTLNNRCERAWTEMLPTLLAELREVVDRHETAGTHTPG